MAKEQPVVINNTEHKTTLYLYSDRMIIKRPNRFNPKKRHIKTTFYYDEIECMHIWRGPYLQIGMLFKNEMQSDTKRGEALSFHIEGIDQQLVDYLNGHPEIMAKFYCENYSRSGTKRIRSLMTPGPTVTGTDRSGWYLERAQLIAQHGER